MLEECLRNKVIRDFLNLYKQARWKKLIPSLIEIAILNLNSSFNTLFFSEEDIFNIIEELKLNQNKQNGLPDGQKQKREIRQHIIFQNPQTNGVLPTEVWSLYHLIILGELITGIFHMMAL